MSDQWTPLEEGRFYLRNYRGKTAQEVAESLYPSATTRERARRRARIDRCLRLARAEETSRRPVASQGRS